MLYKYKPAFLFFFFTRNKILFDCFIFVSHITIYVN